MNLIVFSMRKVVSRFCMMHAFESHILIVNLEVIRSGAALCGCYISNLLLTIGEIDSFARKLNPIQ
jgi:hypothetical protein